MHGARLQYAGIMGGPSLLVVALGLSLWLCWPELPPPPPAADNLPASPRFGLTQPEDGDALLYLKPDLFGRPSVIGFGQPLVERGLHEAVPQHPARRRWMPEAAGAVDAPAEEWTALPGNVALFSSPLEPRQFRVQDALRDVRLNFVPEGELAGRGFRVPLPADERLTRSEHPWMAVATVKVDRDGRVAHVFLERPADDPAVNALLVRWLYRGEASAADRAGAGRVVVNFGR